MQTFPDITPVPDPGTPSRSRCPHPATGRDSSPGHSVAIVRDQPHALSCTSYASSGFPGDTAAVVGPSSPLRHIATCLRKRSVRRETPARSIRSPRGRPASPSPTATATDEGGRGCREGGGRATAAAHRTGQVPQTVARKHTTTPIPPSPLPRACGGCGAMPPPGGGSTSTAPPLPYRNRTAINPRSVMLAQGPWAEVQTAIKPQSAGL